MKAEEFWASLDRTGECWLWTGQLHWKGYGKVWYGGVDWRAHRLAFALANGGIPVESEGKMVLHTCDHPACCNPDHLYLGTHAENMRDRDDRERTAKGERHGCAKLTEAQVAAIRHGRRTGLSARQLADISGVSVRAIERIVAERTWKPAVSAVRSPEEQS